MNKIYFSFLTFYHYIKDNIFKYISIYGGLKFFICAMQFYSLPLMLYFQKQSLVRYPKAELMIDFILAHQDLHATFHAIERLSVISAKTLMDTNIYMTVCLAIPTFFTLKFFTSDFWGKYARFRLKIGIINLFKFSITWIVVYSMINAIIYLVVPSDSFYYPLTLLSEMMVLIIMIQDRAFGCRLVRTVQSSMAAA
ncbi:hypothetical protein [Candidatus Odyssella thessalonicensis]|uniref:hypothetical protein n=1 Tax=Candidatus Odyssella thessalonicensis TaxID=84647 RepID=UPI000225A8DC|nr:hypothetical protein [Candidatus Odyssella thessalonicensis]